MEVYQGIESVEPPLKRSVVTVGNFDGVHLAHQQLIAQAGLLAANAGEPVVVLTFEPHPLSVVPGREAPPRLSLPPQKLAWLEQAGADVTVVARSEPELLNLEPERFVREVLVARLHPTHVVEGPNFGFGRGRRGNPELLKRVGAEMGFEVHVVEPVTLEVDAGASVMISSSLIRRLLAESKVHRAALCLGRPYTIRGEVVPGVQRGRQLGFPTANLALADQMLPGDGVYAGRAAIAGASYQAAISVGTRQTFDHGARQLEVHVLDYTGDLYSQVLEVEFERPLRPQRKFESAETLADQLRRDVAEVRQGPTWTPEPETYPARENP